LDSPQEWYFNASTATLYWAPPLKPDGTAQATPADFHDAGSLVAPTVETLLSIKGESAVASQHAMTGDSATSLVHDVTFEGLSLGETLPTFMQPYEPTAGGDWAVHRGGAVVVENASGIIIRGCRLLAIEGNGILLQHFVRCRCGLSLTVLGLGLGLTAVRDSRLGAQLISAGVRDCRLRRHPTDVAGIRGSDGWYRRQPAVV
jgi:hypothetical protein